MSDGSALIQKFDKILHKMKTKTKTGWGLIKALEKASKISSEFNKTLIP